MPYQAPNGGALFFTLTTAGYVPPHGAALIFGAAAAPAEPVLTIGGVRCGWGRLSQPGQQRQGGWRTLAAVSRQAATPWQPLAPQASALAAPWGRSYPCEAPARAPWGELTPVVAGLNGAWRVPALCDGAAGIAWGDAAAVPALAVILLFAWPAAADLRRALAYGTPAPLLAERGASWIVPGTIDLSRQPRWGQNRRPLVSYPLPPPAAPGLNLYFASQHLPLYLPPAGNALLFATTTAGWLRRFEGGVDPGAVDAYWYHPRRWEIPRPYLRKAYIMENLATLKLLGSQQPLAVASLEISIDRDAWCWSFSANLLRSADLALLRPVNGVPVAVEIELNSWRWRFVVEDLSRQARFGQEGGSVRGRSLSASLAAPYSTGRSAPCGAGTAQQLALAELENKGWTLTWQGADWLIPAGAISWNDQAAMSIISRLAEAAGACVQSHPWQAALTVAPWYSLPPWQWSSVTPAAIIPPAMIEQMAWSFEPRAGYNGVWVRGEQVGVNALVRRTGTDGSHAAPAIVDPLTTAIEAATARGRRVLADAISRERVTLTVPLLANPGLLTPGTLLEVAEENPWRGMVTRCQVRAQRPDIWQTLEVIKVG